MKKLKKKAFKKLTIKTDFYLYKNLLVKKLVFKCL